MQITPKSVTALTLTDAPGITDPIHVFLQDVGPGAGRLTIACYSDAWTGYWGNMGADALEEFLIRVSDDYLANSMYQGSRQAVDTEALTELCRKAVSAKRQADDITEEDADNFEVFLETTCLDDPWEHAEELTDILGEDWHTKLPQMEHPHYMYLRKIVRAVQEAVTLEPAA